MKNHLLTAFRILTKVTLIVSIIFLSPFFVHPAIGATCSGTGCENTNPNTTGCDTGATTQEQIYIDNYKGRVQLRYSGTCNTRWARTYNIYSESLYVKALLYGWYWRKSTGPIPYNQYIYSNQHYGEPYPGFNFKACGRVSTSVIPDGDTGTCTP